MLFAHGLCVPRTQTPHQRLSHTRAQREPKTHSTSVSLFDETQNFILRFIGGFLRSFCSVCFITLAARERSHRAAHDCRDDVYIARTWRCVEHRHRRMAARSVGERFDRGESLFTAALALSSFVFCWQTVRLCSALARMCRSTCAPLGVTLCGVRQWLR